MNNTDNKNQFKQGNQNQPTQNSGPQNNTGPQGQQSNKNNMNPNSGNFANDPERAREAGRKGGQS